VRGLAKKGDKYKCDSCGIVVVIDEDCGCTECDLVCCEGSMEKC